MTISEAIKQANDSDPDAGYATIIYVCDECDVAHEAAEEGEDCEECGTKVEGVRASGLASRGYADSEE